MIDEVKMREAHIIVSKMFPLHKVTITVDKISVNNTCDNCKHLKLLGAMRVCQMPAWTIQVDGFYYEDIDDGFCCNRYEEREM